ncbi:MAG: EF-hand domain-containing protein [Xenococcus sp. (in: cyanobacteria)]
MSQKKIVDLFYEIDKNENGYINFQELIAGVATNEEFKKLLKLSGDYEQIAKDILSKFDRDLDSKIDMPEFIQMIRTLESQ